MEDKHYKKLWHQLTDAYSSSSILITEKESNEFYSSILKTYSDIQPHTTTTTNTQTESNNMEYFSEKGHTFLKYCCDSKLKLYSFQVTDEYGQIIVYDIKFSYLRDDLPHRFDTFRITFQKIGEMYDYEYVDSNYSDSIELSNKLKYIMRAVYNHITFKQFLNIKNLVELIICSIFTM
jgi:hypothetical protein